MGLYKPEYLFRPSSIFNRGARSEVVSVRLPWGLPITVSTSDDIGRAVCRKGVYDLPVTEALWRLTDPGEVAFDVGANIGYMSAVLAAREGRVYAFEPHPANYPKLAKNAERWPGVETINTALSDRDGPLRLTDPPKENGGAARVSEAGGHEVEARRVDSLDLPEPRVFKLDVEGHELSVLGGLGTVRPRDIVFEEHAPYPSPVTEFLESAGYAVFNLGVSLFRPLLCDPRRPRSRAWEPSNFLATLDPARARRRFEARGWRCLTEGRPAG
jgi:FkbM family methyltransferase